MSNDNALKAWLLGNLFINIIHTILNLILIKLVLFYIFCLHVYQKLYFLVKSFVDFYGYKITAYVTVE